MDKVEIVERPSRSSKKYPYDEIVATAETGKAVRIALAGVSFNSAQRTLHTGLNTRGYKGHVRDPKDGTLIIWAEKRP